MRERDGGGSGGRAGKKIALTSVKVGKLSNTN